MTGGIASLRLYIGMTTIHLIWTINPPLKEIKMTPTKGKHGGARPGAGRKKSPPVLLRASPAVAQGPEPDSIRVLRSITIDESLDVKLRLDAAKALAPFEALRKGDGGKKDEQAIAAKKASVGRFAPSAPPLSVVK